MMYLKLILCYVKKENRQEFTERQRAWSDIKDVNGLIFQVGGWSNINTEIACKLALWQSKEFYADFHLNVHDELARKAGHQHLYYKIETDFFFPQQELSPGNKLTGMLNASTFLRVADCHVHASYVQQFLDAQEKIWIPAMQHANGMHGGYFSKHEKEPRRFLVCSFWSNGRTHGEYVSNQVPQLRERSQVAATVSEMKSYYVHLLPEWTAIGAGVRSS